MTGSPLLMTCLTAAAFAAWSPLALGRVVAFAPTSRSAVGNAISTTVRRMSSSSAAGAQADDAAICSGISRLEVLQTLLSKRGAPGSSGCAVPCDLIPASESFVPDLHPHLVPLARSDATGNYVCALRRAYADDAEYESSSDAPWPIVEGRVGAPGMRLLALNSEHLMRRIAAEADDAGNNEDIISLYNEGLGEGHLKDAGLDNKYDPGSVAKLGYGADKFVLLRVGPFPDLYEKMALGHAERGDESSALIAAEAANGKFTGFGSTFAFYSKLLATFPQREEESRDAARMCLRLPLPSMGLTMEDFASVSQLAGLADKGDSPSEAVAKMQLMYEKIRKHEDEEEQGAASKTPEQVAIDEANYVLDTTALNGAKWGDVREKLAAIYHSAGKDDMAKFVDPSR